MSEEIQESKESKERVSKHEIIFTDRKSKKGLKTILIIFSVLMIVGIVVGVFVWHAIADYNLSRADNEYIVLAPALNICEKTKTKKGEEPKYKEVEQVPFGVIVELHREGTREGEKTYYKILSAASSALKFDDKEYYLEALTDNDLQEVHYSGSQERYMRIFPLKEAQELPSHIKKAVLDYINQSSDDYHFTQDANLIKQSIVFADFNMDGEQDVAVMLDSDSYPNRLLVLCYNPTLKQSYKAFTTDWYSGVGLLSTFRKGAQVFIDSEKLTPAPNTGIMYEALYTNYSTKYAIFYNPKTMRFEQYTQKPLSELQAETEGGDGDADYEESGDEPMEAAADGAD